MLFSLQEDDVVESKKSDQTQMSVNRIAAENKKKLVANVVTVLQWLFGWLPRSYIKMIS